MPTYAHLVLDPSGCYGGKPGQIVLFHYKAGPEIRLFHGSFDEWLRTVFAKQKAGILFTPMDEMGVEQDLQLGVIQDEISPSQRQVEAAPFPA